jgi:hypothetical protein
MEGEKVKVSRWSELQREETQGVLCPELNVWPLCPLRGKLIDMRRAAQPNLGLGLQGGTTGLRTKDNSAAASAQHVCALCYRPAS